MKILKFEKFKKKRYYKGKLAGFDKLYKIEIWRMKVYVLTELTKPKKGNNTGHTR